MPVTFRTDNIHAVRRDIASAIEGLQHCFTASDVSRNAAVAQAIVLLSEVQSSLESVTACTEEESRSNA